MSDNCIAVVYLPSEDLNKNVLYGASLRSINAYAKKHHLPVEIIRERKFPSHLPPHVEKFQVADLLQTYKRVLLLDLDILISIYAPNIFDEFSDESYIYGYNEAHLPWVLEDMRKFERHFGVPYNGYLLNGGVILWSRVGLPALQGFNVEEFMPSFGNAGEQSYLNMLLHRHKIPLRDLPQVWNWCLYSDAKLFDNRFKAYFVHYAADGNWIGQKSKYIQMKEDSELVW